MKKRTEKNRRRTRQEVDALLGRYHSSGMTVRAFCQSEGIAESLVYRRLRAQRTSTPSSKLVEVKPPPSRCMSFTVATPQGYRVEVPVNFGAEDLQRLLGALKT